MEICAGGEVTESGGERLPVKAAGLDFATRLIFGGSLSETGGSRLASDLSFISAE